MNDDARAQQPQRPSVAKANPVQAVGLRLLPLIMAVGIVASVIAVWGKPVSSIAASVIVVALLAFAQDQPVYQAIPTALGHFAHMREWITNAGIQRGSAPSSPSPSEPPAGDTSCEISSLPPP
jgi:membrane protein YdbS with pleckstrin-like domain